MNKNHFPIETFIQPESGYVKFDNPIAVAIRYNACQYEDHLYSIWGKKLPHAIRQLRKYLAEGKHRKFVILLLKFQIRVEVSRTLHHSVFSHEDIWSFLNTSRGSVSENMFNWIWRYWQHYYVNKGNVEFAMGNLPLEFSFGKALFDAAYIDVDYKFLKY